MPVLLKAICRFNAIPIQTTMTLITDIENNPNIHMEPKIPQIVKAILSKYNNVLPDFKIHYKENIIKTVWYWHKTDIWNNETQ